MSEAKFCDRPGRTTEVGHPRLGPSLCAADTEPMSGSRPGPTSARCQGRHSFLFIEQCVAFLPFLPLNFAKSASNSQLHVLITIKSYVC